MELLEDNRNSLRNPSKFQKKYLNEFLEESRWILEETSEVIPKRISDRDPRGITEGGPKWFVEKPRNKFLDEFEEKYLG